MRQIRAAIGATTINPALLTAAEKLQYDGYLRREEMGSWWPIGSDADRDCALGGRRF